MPGHCVFCGNEAYDPTYRIHRCRHDIKGPFKSGHYYVRVCGKLWFTICTWRQPGKEVGQVAADIKFPFNRCKNCYRRHKNAFSRICFKEKPRLPGTQAPTPNEEEEVAGPSVETIWSRALNLRMSQSNPDPLPEERGRAYTYERYVPAAQFDGPPSDILMEAPLDAYTNPVIYSSWTRVDEDGIASSDSDTQRAQLHGRGPITVSASPSPVTVRPQKRRKRR